MVNIDSYVGYNADGIKTLFVYAEFDENYILNQSIEQIVIGNEGCYTVNSYPSVNSNDDYTVIDLTETDSTDPITKVYKEIPIAQIGDNHLYIIYVKVNSDNANSIDLAQAKCADQKEYYIGLSYDYTKDVCLALSLVGELDECNCDVPVNYINQILRLQALKFAIKSNCIEKAVDYFNRFFKKSKEVQVKKGCGCHG